MNIIERARRFDTLIQDAHFQYEHFSKLAHACTDGRKGYYEGAAHAFLRILYYADYADIRPDCPCRECTERRMQAKERTLVALDQQQRKEIGESYG